MTPETRAVLANCAGSFLLLLAFLLLILTSAVLLLILRGLWLARRAGPEQVARVQLLADRARVQTSATAASVVGPQIRLASSWVGIKAGARSLLNSTPTSPSADGNDGDEPH